MKNNRQPGCRGFTMVEMMGAVVISVILIMLLFQIFDRVQSTLVVSQNRARAMEQGRNAMDIMVQDFRSLGAASLRHPIHGMEIPNIDWGDDPGMVDKIGFLAPIDFTNQLWQAYQDHAQEVYRHQCRFFANDEGWRFVDYKFGGRNHWDWMNPDSPVGALWVYRSREVSSSGLLAERADHDALKLHDPNPNHDPDSVSREQDGLVGYSRVVDGVIHFRVRAVSPLDPGRMWGSLTNSFFTGHLVPSLVEVEIAVVDEKLVAEMEKGIGQRMEGETNTTVKLQARMEYLKKNLDRVYFFKQLISIQGKGQ